MRSPLALPGRPTVLERIFRSLNLFNRTEIEGTQRSQSRQRFFDDETLYGRDYDLEIREPLVRDPMQYRPIIEMVEHCPEVATALNILGDDIFSSIDGDDQGFTLAPTLNDNETPIDPEVERILRRLIEEVIGGVALEPAIDRVLGYGDAFASLGLSKKQDRIEQVLFLPTFEMFRVETNAGQLLGFQQRPSLQSEQDAIEFFPLRIVHWRYRRKSLYGRSLFAESVPDWQALKNAIFDLSQAARQIGINPTIHLMPDGVGDRYRADYKKQHEDRLSQGAILHYYLDCGAELTKLSATNPDLKALIDTVQLFRQRIAMRSRVPPWLLGMPSIGAREIAGQPALAYARFVNRVRMAFVDGLRQICNLELALNKIERSRWQYRIIFPKIYIDPLETQLNPEQVAEVNEGGVEDLDQAKMELIGNGHY